MFIKQSFHEIVFYGCDRKDSPRGDTATLMNKLENQKKVKFVTRQHARHIAD